MTLLIKGIYRDGVFYPTEPVALANNTPVKMKVDTIAEDAKAETPLVKDEPGKEESDAERERRAVHEALVAAGVVRPGPVPGPTRSIGLSEREREIARKLAEGGPVYDIIREERDSN